MQSLQHYRILIVDDRIDNLLLMQTLLEAEGYSIDTADSGALALTKVRASPPHLILLDLRMPDIDGFEVTRRLRQNNQFSSIPILIVTADYDVSEAGLQVGINGFIHKPIDFDKLLKKVEELVRQAPLL